MAKFHYLVCDFFTSYYCSYINYRHIKILLKPHPPITGISSNLLFKPFTTLTYSVQLFLNMTAANGILFPNGSQ